MSDDGFDDEDMRPRRARITDPWTSHEAADRVSEITARHYRIIMNALRHGPGTQYDISDRTVLMHDQVHKRLPEMERLGMIRLAGYSKPSPSNRMCRVWRINDEEPEAPTPVASPVGPSQGGPADHAAVSAHAKGSDES
jgi:hypothetical protein